MSVTRETHGKPAILVTGGAGYIGSHAALALLDRGWPVVVLDNLVTGFAWAVPAGARPSFEGDIADADLVAKLIREHGIGAIIHFAGSVVVPESVADPLKYYENNTVKSRALIASAVAGGVRHFIFSSTAATYGIPDRVPVAEDARTAPINPYGWSKLMTERMLADTAAAHPINYCALRYFNVAGADPQGRAGQSTAGATHLIKVAVEAATGKRGHVSVFGTGLRHARRHRRARLYPCQRPRRRACSRAREADRRPRREPCHELRLWARLLGDRGARQRRSRHQPARSSGGSSRAAPGDPDALVADNAEILATLPWRPQRDDLDTIVADALAWERKLAEHKENGDVAVG